VGAVTEPRTRGDHRPPITQPVVEAADVRGAEGIRVEPRAAERARLGPQPVQPAVLLADPALDHGAGPGHQRGPGSEQLIGPRQQPGGEKLVENAAADRGVELRQPELLARPRIGDGQPADAQTRDTVGLGQRGTGQHPAGKAGEGGGRRGAAVGRFPVRLVHQQHRLGAAAGHGREHLAHLAVRDGDSRRILRRSEHDQPGACGQAVPERVKVDAVAVLEARGHRDDPGAEAAQGIERRRKARHPHEDLAVAVQQCDQEQRRRCARGEQDLLAGMPSRAAIRARSSASPPDVPYLRLRPASSAGSRMSATDRCGA